MEPGFAALREEFCRAHCGVFEAGEGENKLEYMDLFTQYTALIDGHLEAALAGAMPGVSASEAVTLLAEAAGQEEGGLLAEVLEDLLAMSDFEAFKELMLGYKAEAEGRHAGLCVQVRPLQVHVEEQEEGDARPDLDFGIITVTSTKQPGGRSTPASVPPQVAPAAQKGGPRAAGGPGWR